MTEQITLRDIKTYILYYLREFHQKSVRRSSTKDEVKELESLVDSITEEIAEIHVEKYFNPVVGTKSYTNSTKDIMKLIQILTEKEIRNMIARKQVI